MNTPWEEVSLGEVADDVTVGHVGPMADQYVEAGVPFLRSLNVEPFRINTTDLKHISREFHQRLQKSALKPGDVVIVRTGKPGSCAVIPDWLSEANCSDLVVVRANPRVRPSFISYVVNSSAAHHIDAHTVGAVQQHFNVSSARQIRFQLPSIAEQDRILRVLGALDDKIELNRRMNETLEAMARAIFKDWFVDFGPTRAKMEGRAPYLAPNIWSLFPDRLDANGMPEGWRTGKLGDIAKQVGQTVSPETLGPDTPYIGLEHMPRRSIALSEWEGAGKVTSGKLAFQKGDFLFGKLRPYFHKVGIAPLDGICSTDIVVLNARERSAAAFVLVCISQDEFVAFTDRTSDGTKMPRTSWSRMESYGVCLPDEAALEAFDAIANPMLCRIVANIHESRTLVATRDLLLPKLMSGEVRVKDAEKLVGEVT